MPYANRLTVFVAAVLSGLGAVSQQADAGEPRSPVKVTIKDEKPVAVQPVLSFDPEPRIRYQSSGNLAVAIRSESNQQLHLSHFPMLQVDGKVMGGRNGAVGVGTFEVVNEPLPKTPGGKARLGFMTVWVDADLRITFTGEIVPTKPSERKQKARLDAVLLRYSIENKGKQTRKVGMKVYMDTYIITNDGALFAAPGHKGILDGVELKGKTLPDYVQVLQNPDLKNPGFVAHLTLNVGGAEKASRVVLSSHGAGGFNAWEMPAVRADGDSALAVFWDAKEIQPGGKREVAYAYGQGVAVAPDPEGQVVVQLGGSFEPGKLFSVTALVNDPIPGQRITLELPPGMERIEGKETQAVPAAAEEGGNFVVWKARVLKTGTFPIIIRSSTGEALTKIVAISKAE